ncbi:MAG: hypothetical protein L7U72_18155 [Rubripirellula sp.]|nr:hypothetical protein [Rubripirellula sp.]
MNWRLATLLVWLSILSANNTLLACNVPVFRYALERWQSDNYELIILHRRDLTPKEQQKIAMIRQSTRASGAALNLRVRECDLRAEVDRQLEVLTKGIVAANDSPTACLLYSANSREVPDRIVTTMPLEDLDAEALLASPARQKIANQLLDGQSAVWIFVSSGDQVQDAEALRRLKDQIEWNKANLKLPEQDVLEADEFFDQENPIELKIDFSIVKVDRNDPREQFLIAMLMGSEADLVDLSNQPMAFPVIGRGRVLYALVGQGIYKDTIEMACKFVVGPCSCQVKDQNPGFDLLFDVDWDLKVGGKTLSRESGGQKKPPVLIQIPSGK